MVKKKPVCHFLILDTAKNFRVPVSLCHFDSTLVLFLFPIFPPPTTFSSYQSATEVEKFFMKRICELFLAKYVFTNFHKIERCFLPFSAACCRKQTDRQNPTQFCMIFYVSVILSSSHIIWSMTLCEINWGLYHKKKCLFVIVSF